MPLLGAIGNASQQSFRGNYDNYPFDINFGDLVDAIPGQIYTTSLELVDGINYKVPISISGDGEYYVGNLTFDKTFDNIFIKFNETVTTFDATFPDLDYSILPTYVRNGNTVGLRILGVPPKIIDNNITIIDRSSAEYTIPLNSPITIETRDGDYTFNPDNSVQFDDRTFQGDEVGIEYYDKTYSTTVTIGKREFTWTVNTEKAAKAENLIFINKTDVGFLTDVISNTYTVKGLTDEFNYTAEITSNEGLLSVNYDNFIKSATVKNGDILRLKVTSSNLSFTPKTVVVRISLDVSPNDVQTTTSWSVRTLDNVPSNLSFADISSAEINAEILSEIVKINGLINNIDFNVEIVSPDDASLIINPQDVDLSIFNTIISITGDDGSSISLDPSQLAEYDTFVPGIEYTLKSNADVVVELYAVGGGGGGSGSRNVSGSSGGLSQGTFTFLEGETYKLIVGESGGDGALIGNDGTALGGFPGGGDAPSSGTSFNRSGAGGGYTGLFINSVTQANAILIAGGGGGSTGDPGYGGSGGGIEGASGSNQFDSGRFGKGGTQSAGGASGTTGIAGESGSSLKGGNGGGRGGGGGGGYFGGGGGANTGPGSGGGGSGYLHPTLLSNATTQTGGGNNAEVSGSFRIIFQSVSSPSPFVKSAIIRNGDNLQLKLNTTGNWLEEKTVTVKLENTSANWKVKNRNIKANSDDNADKLIFALPLQDINKTEDMSPDVRVESGLAAGLQANAFPTVAPGKTSPSISTEQSKFYGDIGSLQIPKGTSTSQFQTTTLKVITDSSQSLGYSDFTIEMWVYLSGFNFNGQTGISLFYPNYLDNKNSNDYFFQLFLKGDNWSGYTRGILLGFPNTAGTAVNTLTETTSQVLIQNSWNHIAVTRQGNLFKIFVNGILRGSGSKSVDLTSSSYTTMLNNFQVLLSENVYVQDFRMYKGVAKYTSNFNTSNVTSIMEQYSP